VLRCLIIGFGNPLRSDDGIGWHVAREFSHEFQRDDVQVIAAHQLTPEMAEAASRAERVLFVDATHKGKPGIVRCEPVAPVARASHFTHELSPASILMLAQELYGHCPPAYLLTVAGESFETGDTMSASVIAAIQPLIKRIRQLVDGERG
jgi:hydrogenase maturation protease